MNFHMSNRSLLLYRLADEQAISWSPGICAAGDWAEDEKSLFKWAMSRPTHGLALSFSPNFQSLEDDQVDSYYALIRPGRSCHNLVGVLACLTLTKTHLPPDSLPEVHRVVDGSF